MNDIIHSVIRRLDVLERPVFTYDELYRWPDGTIAQLEALKLLREAENHHTVRCDSCDENEILYPPEIIHDAQRGRPMAAAWCPRCGRIVYEIDRLRMWEVDFEYLAQWLTKELALTPTVRALVPNQLLVLGWLGNNGSTIDVLLGRRMHLADTDVIKLSTLQNFPGDQLILLVPDRSPSTAIGQEVAFKTLSLINYLQWDDQSHHIGVTSLAQRLKAISSAIETSWLTVTQCAQMLLQDISGIDLSQAKARVSKAASNGRFKTNGKTGANRRIDKHSFSTWRLEQREKDLDAEETKIG